MEWISNLAFSTPGACISLRSHACFLPSSLAYLRVVPTCPFCSCLHISSFVSLSLPLALRPPPTLLLRRPCLQVLPPITLLRPLPPPTSRGIPAPLPAFSQMSSHVSQWPTEPPLPFLITPIPMHARKHMPTHMHTCTPTNSHTNTDTVREKT